MSNQNQDAVIQQLMALDKQTLATRAAKLLGQYQGELARKDRLIADLTANRERAHREASEIVEDAQRQAAIIRSEAQTMKERSDRKIAEADADVARKLANANAEADSIVETRLSAAQGDIARLESQREDCKKQTVALNRSIVEEYNGIIEDITRQLSRLKDIQARLDDLSANVEAEDFKKFDMSDYVTVSGAVRPAPQPQGQPYFATAPASRPAGTLSENELAALSGLLDYGQKPAVAPQSQQPAYLSDWQPQPQAYQPQLQPQPQMQPQPQPQAYQPQAYQPASAYQQPYQQPQVQAYQQQPQMQPQQQPQVQQPQVQPQPQIQPQVQPQQAVNRPQATIPEPEPQPAPAPEPEPQPIPAKSVTDSIDFDDIDFDEEIGFDDFGDFDDNGGDAYDNGKMKSFTDAFMAVNSAKPATQEAYDSILDDDDDIDEPAPAVPQRLNIPQRPNRTRNASPARWITK